MATSAFVGACAIAEILSGTKGAPGSGEHQHSRPLFDGLLQCFTHFKMHGHIKTVEALWAVESQSRHDVADVEENTLVAHFSLRLATTQPIAGACTEEQSAACNAARREFHRVPRYPQRVPDRHG